jgi:hypothetical protein
MCASPSHAFAGVVLAWLKMGFPCPNAEGGVDVAGSVLFFFQILLFFLIELNTVLLRPMDTLHCLSWLELVQTTFQ